MKVSIEKIDILVQRTGVGYKTAQEVLEMCDGNIVDALIYLEELSGKGKSKGKEQQTVSGATENKRARTESSGPRRRPVLMRWITDSKLVIAKPGQEILNIPLIIAIILIALLRSAVLALLLIGLAVFSGYNISIIPPTSKD